MPKKKAAASAKQDDFRVRIRMYRQGLGDCFLLSFPKAGKQVHMLIDCGIVLGTSEPDVVMKRVAEDVKAETGGKLDLLVITHEHWDHLSGFDGSQAREVFDGIDIKTLWLAWTEQEGNALADALREEREKKKAAAKAAAQKAKEKGNTLRAARVAGLLGMFGAGAAGDGNEEGEDGGGTAGALAYLKSKCAPTILETGNQTYTVPGVDGIRIYVLGPPMDRAALKKTNPSKGEGYGLGAGDFGLADAFLAAVDPSNEQRAELAQPFAPSLRRSEAELKARLAAAKVSGDQTKAGIDWYHDPDHAWRSIDDAWLATGERLALQLDNATNNTSLVLAFEFEASKEVLLFVGDAQAGNWRSWDNCKWTVKDKDGEKRDVTAEQLLTNTIFYKVGHHGSHNATMQAKGLERMTHGRLAAVIPVDTKVAHDVKDWKEMPLPAIQDRLKEKCAVLFQTDADPIERKNLTPKIRWAHSAEKFDVRMKNKATKKVETVRKQNLYTDVFL